MSNCSISIYFNHHKKNIPFHLIPHVDESIQSVITGLHQNHHPPASLMIMSDRVKDLTKTQELLSDAKNHILRDKLLGFFSTSLLIGLVGSTVLGMIINPMIGIGILLLTLGYLIYSHVKASSLSNIDHKEEHKYLSIYPLGVLMSPFIFSYSLLTRQSSLEAQIRTCEQSICYHMSRALPYWSKHGQQLIQHIQNIEQKVEKSLGIMQTLPIRSPQGEKDLVLHKNLLSRARIEIEKGVQMTKI